MTKITILSILLLGCASESRHTITPQTPKPERVLDTTALKEVFTNGGYYVPKKSKK